MPSIVLANGVTLTVRKHMYIDRETTREERMVFGRTIQTAAGSLAASGLSASVVAGEITRRTASGPIDGVPRVFCRAAGGVVYYFHMETSENPPHVRVTLLYAERRRLFRGAGRVYGEGVPRAVRERLGDLPGEPP